MESINNDMDNWDFKQLHDYYNQSTFSDFFVDIYYDPGVYVLPALRHLSKKASNFDQHLIVFIRSFGTYFEIEFIDNLLEDVNSLNQCFVIMNETKFLKTPKSNLLLIKKKISKTALRLAITYEEFERVLFAVSWYFGSDPDDGLIEEVLRGMIKTAKTENQIYRVEIESRRFGGLMKLIEKNIDN